jgi:hypothetical protein
MPLNPRLTTGFLCPWWAQLLLALALWGLFSAVALGQIKQWDKTYGGDISDYGTSIQQTKDGGYILGGYSFSGVSGDKTESSRGSFDYWVVKLDAAGNKVWDKTIGGDGYDGLSSLQQTKDGGYILGGRSDSGINGDKTESSRGEADFWVVKLDAAGNKVWDKTIGGKYYEDLISLKQTKDGGYILGGRSSSGISGEKTENSRGDADFWVVKLDWAGNKVWDKTFGGSETDVLIALQQTQDGGYILGGYSFSGVSGDKTESSRGSFDYWVVKLDAAGNKQWDKTYGGAFTDYGTSLLQTQDGGYMLGGYSFSSISGDKTESSRGNADYWVVKLDTAGNKQWDKTYGGNESDHFTSLWQTQDGGYILGGHSSSGISGEKTEPGKGGSDYWVVRLDAAGNKQWDKTYGGNNIDYCAALQQTQDGGYMLGGYSISDKSGDKTEDSRGNADFWVVKLAAELPPPRVLSFSPTKGLPGTLVTLTGQHLSTTRAVRFNGLEATFKVISNEVVQATVPVNAVSGNIEVETAGGQAASSSPFTVLQPEIAAFLPAQGRVGSRVYLVGNRLTTTQDVYFNGVRSPRVKVYLNWVISAVVPAGATTGKIKVVLQGGGAATSESDFTVLPAAAPVIATQALAPEGTPGGTTVPGKMEAPRVVAYPNPFQQQVNFSFTLAQPQPVVVKVYDLLGRQVGLLYQGEARARQAYQLEWRPPAQLPGGLYNIRLQSPGYDIQRKIMLAR